MPVTREIVDEKAGIQRYTLSSETVTAKVINLGATLTHLIVKDAQGGQDVDVVLGFDNWKEYLGEHNRYFGATVGRVANRIAKGTFQLNDTDYQLAVNSGPNALHGGLKGFDKAIWAVEMVPVDTHPACITCRLFSADGDQGYPGSLAAEVTYSVEDDGSLIINYVAHLKGDEDDTAAAEEAGSGKATIINLTNHSYFNLSGGSAPTILQNTLQLYSDQYLLKDDTDIPTGVLQQVKEQPAFDFTVPKPVGQDMASIVPKTGYDHCYVVRGVDVEHASVSGGGELRKAAVVTCSESGICMTFSTTEPGFQLYTAYFLDGEARGKSTQADFAYGPYAALCLEAQRFPDAVNHEPWRKQVVLCPGQEYRQRTVYAFQVSNK